jgi:hypothetical protein
MAEAGKDDEFTRGGLMVKDGPVEGRCDGTGELLVSVPSACKTVSQVAIGTVSVRMAG